MINHKKIAIFVICILLCAGFFYWQNNAIEVTNYTFSSDEIPSDFEGYRIVQISDLHNKSFGKQPNRLIQEIENLHPDMIVITGDVVDSNHTKLQTAIEFFERATEIAPCYYITGNHELWLDESVRTDLMNQITATGTQILNNESIHISVNTEPETVNHSHNSFTLIGLDDGNLTDDTFHTLTQDIDSKQFVLLLAHEPQNIMLYSRENVDLILSGHAHGGQFRVPGVGGLVAPDQGFFPEYTEGLHEENGVSMIISRGLGNSVIPVRIFNRPEIVCVELACE